MRKPPIKELILSGASTNFTGLLGALDELYQRNLHIQIKRYVGSSIGSVICFLLIIGYTPRVIYEVALNINYSLVDEITCDNVLGFFDNMGIIPAETMLSLLKIFMKIKQVDYDITFQQLYTQYKKKLRVVAWCVEDQESICFHAKKYPTLSVLKALEMSISIPFLFHPVFWMDKHYVDGGVLDNLPVKFAHNLKTCIAININLSTVLHPPLTMLSYINAIFRRITKELSVLKIDKYQCPRIEVYIHDNCFLNGNVSADFKQSLFIIGQQCAKNYFDSL